jgi:succinate dehydrogenase / fumarate reductase cytochrome b subunit
MDYTVPSAFIWRRVHSLTGLWLVLYLIEHLLVNSQAALWLGADGTGFVHMVDLFKSIPYLQVIETVLIGIPLLIHGIWGVKRALSAKVNALPYERNKSFNWQRITAWILLVGITFHVIQMRFMDNPKTVKINGDVQSLVKVTFDEGLYSLAPRLGVSLYSSQQIEEMKRQEKGTSRFILPIQELPFLEGRKPVSYETGEGEVIARMQQTEEERNFVKKLGSFKLKQHQVVAAGKQPGSVILLSVRDTFKSPFMALFYTLFVLAAAFHAFNGFWTFLITWGVILSYPSQRSMAKVSWVGIFLLSFFGLAAIWGSYWMNLRY